MERKGWKKPIKLISFQWTKSPQFMYGKQKLVVPVWLHSCSKNFCFAYVVKELNSTKTTFAPLNKQLKKIHVVAVFQGVVKATHISNQRALLVFLFLFINLSRSNGSELKGSFYSIFIIFGTIKLKLC